jgi:hypothetical protein
MQKKEKNIRELALERLWEGEKLLWVGRERNSVAYFYFSVAMFILMPIFAQLCVHWTAFTVMVIVLILPFALVLIKEIRDSKLEI